MLTFNVNTLLAILSLVGSIGAVFVFVNRLHWEVSALHKENEEQSKRIAVIETTMTGLQGQGSQFSHTLEKQLHAFEARIETRFGQLENRIERLQAVLMNTPYGRRATDTTIA